MCGSFIRWHCSEARERTSQHHQRSSGAIDINTKLLEGKLIEANGQFVALALVAQTQRVRHTKVDEVVGAMRVGAGPCVGGVAWYRP